MTAGNSQQLQLKTAWIQTRLSFTPAEQPWTGYDAEGEKTVESLDRGDQTRLIRQWQHLALTPHLLAVVSSNVAFDIIPTAVICTARNVNNASLLHSK